MDLPTQMASRSDCLAAPATSSRCGKTQVLVHNTAIHPLPKLRPTMKMKQYRVRVLRLLAMSLAVVGLAQPAHANIVGFANVTLTNAYNFIANPFDTSPNSITNVLGTNAPDGSMVFLWDVTNQVFTLPSTYHALTKSWDRNYFLSPGRGFVMLSTANKTLTFVGNVLQGNLTNFVAGTNKFSLLASMVPVSDTLSNLFFPGTDGDNVYVFKTASQSYSDAFTYFAGFGWFDPNGAITTNGPVINIAQSFFVQNPGPGTNWIRNFVVQAAQLQSAALVANSSSPEIQSLSLSAGLATLHVLNPSGSSYNVEFSTDGVAWTTVATNQTATTWSAPCPGGGRGYYRLSTP